VSNPSRSVDVAVVHATRAAAAAAAGRVADLLFRLAAAPSDQAPAARFRPFLLFLLELMFVVVVTGCAASGRTGSGGLLHASRRFGVADVRAGPALQRTRQLVFRSVQPPGEHQQTLEQLAHVHVVLGRALDQLDPAKKKNCCCCLSAYRHVLFATIDNGNRLDKVENEFVLIEIKIENQISI